MMAAAAPTILAPPVATGAAAPVNWLTIGATGVDDCTTDVAHTDVGATGVGVGVMTGAGAVDDQSCHCEEVAGTTGATGVELDQSCH